MTKEQAIEEIYKDFEPAYANYIITALAEGATISDKALEQQPSDDCVSRAEVIEELNRLGRNAFKDDTDYDNFFAFIDSLPPVTPTYCIAVVKFSKDDIRNICNERIEIECTHGTCKDCESWDKEEHFCSMLDCDTGKDFYCADFEKRGSEDD